MSSSWSRPLFNLDCAAWREIRRRHPDRLPPALRVRFTAAGLLFSAMRRWQERRWRAAIDAVALAPPLFVVGHWRSGTSWLHELIALNPAFATPRSHACFNPHHFLLTRDYQPAPRHTIRPTGDLEVSPASPQEEEFALMCLGAVSPYEAFMFPAAMESLDALCEVDRFAPAQALKWDATMLWFAKATALAQGRTRLLTKSPTNSFRVRRLARLFPGARFILIVRDPLAVFASTMRLWQVMWHRYALAPALPEAALAERILAIRLAMERSLESARAALPPDTVAEVRYEDLRADPYRVVAGLYERTGIAQPPALREQVAACVAAHPAPPPATDTADRWRAWVRREWSAVCERYSYPAP